MYNRHYTGLRLPVLAETKTKNVLVADKREENERKSRYLPAKYGTVLRSQAFVYFLFKSSLLLCFVFLSPKDKNNVAFGKPAAMSTLFHNGQNQACHGVDGDMKTLPHDGQDTPKWWCVDLQQIYNFKEVKIYNFAPSEYKNNVAFGKPAAMSSLYDKGQYPACHGVDGDVKTLSHDGQRTPKWWCVDLQQIYNFKEVKIYNFAPGEWGKRQLQYFTMKLSNHGLCDDEGFNNSEVCYQDNLPDAQFIYNITHCTSSLPFISRFIYLTVHSTSIYLHFLEMVVSAL
ncbi:hypothetical protein LOTGIDRAFT_159801 [Lottia gigantea]|uniref:Fucolectin tachylectin-4 pentraxin-1 domain-containing protein n=1 Tax=Lottia gigantea TaxID=225164 RepID=V4AHK8_LOTGI|nr:hypothetical protein LOTGIDRAFT_159801 [Lottia gigantea]ESO96397.1 hypothetical protein LOTGIDRAFT_159801 [Lottia gigantea]